MLAALKAAGLRAETDLRNEKINYKVREHSLAKVPVMLVVGKREAEERTVSVRRLGSQEQQVMSARRGDRDAGRRGRAARSARKPPTDQGRRSPAHGMARHPILTIGHSRHSLERFLSLLDGASDGGGRCALGAGVALLAAFQQERS